MAILSVIAIRGKLFTDLDSQSHNRKVLFEILSETNQIFQELNNSVRFFK